MVTDLVPADSPTPEQMIMHAIDKGTPIETLEKLFDLAERASFHQQRAALYSALSAFQSELPEIKKTKLATVRSERTGTTFTYRYADLADIQKAIAPYLGKHGLSYKFEPHYGDTPERDLLACVIHHADGYDDVTEVRLTVDSGAWMNAIQAGGSALTYAKRYALCAALGIAPDEDTDAGEGTGPGPGQVNSGASAGHAAPSGKARRQPGPSPRQREQLDKAYRELATIVRRQGIDQRALISAVTGKSWSDCTPEDVWRIVDAAQAIDAGRARLREENGLWFVEVTNSGGDSSNEGGPEGGDQSSPASI